MNIQLGGWLFFGAPLTAWSTVRLWAGWSAQAWPVARGEVIERSVRTRRGKSGQLFFVPHVRYRFEVDGREYTGHRLTFRVIPFTSPVPSPAYEELRGLRSGTTVEVRYHPWRPSLSVLQPGCLSQDLLAAASGVLLLGGWYFG